VHPNSAFPLQRLLDAAAAVPDGILTRLGEPYLIWWAFFAHARAIAACACCVHVVFRLQSAP
jgi:hypothetical protein